MTEDNSRTVTATLTGAVLGAIVGYLVRELDRTRHTLNAGIATAHEGGTQLSERRVEQEPPP